MKIIVEAFDDETLMIKIPAETAERMGISADDELMAEDFEKNLILVSTDNFSKRQTIIESAKQIIEDRKNALNQLK